jgi:hypothetical protein
MANTLSLHDALQISSIMFRVRLATRFCSREIPPL